MKLANNNISFAITIVKNGKVGNLQAISTRRIRLRHNSLIQSKVINKPLEFYLAFGIKCEQMVIYNSVLCGNQCGFANRAQRRAGYYPLTVRGRLRKPVGVFSYWRYRNPLRFFQPQQGRRLQQRIIVCRYLLLLIIISGNQNLYFKRIYISNRIYIFKITPL